MPLYDSSPPYLERTPVILLKVYGSEILRTETLPRTLEAAPLRKPTQQ